jgi:UDP-N-acetylglucosamine 4,6-dehydratase
MTFHSLLITGGSGYLGHGLVERLLKTEPDSSRICIYSRDEAKQAKMRALFNDDRRLRFFIGDVRDLERLRIAVNGCQYVVHAAALKRVDAVEYNVMEAVATNITGTGNVVRAALDARVPLRRVVLVSTDKACEPTTTYGYTKAVAEAIMRNAHAYAGSSITQFAVVRYGNVAGSTGSVIPMWRENILQNKVCEIRDPDVTRFWMTRTEAVDFVLDALETARQGETRVPTLPAYRLGDLAVAMGVEQFRLTSLPNGEKKHESMEPGKPSNLARRMDREELERELANV